MKNISCHTIQLHQLVPAYINPSGDSAIWKQEVTFEKGYNYLIEAASGRGKSSLMAILYGLKKNYTGQVCFDQHNLQHFSWQDWARLRSHHLSMVFQDLKLLPHYTGLENILLKAALYGTPNMTQITAMAQQLHVQHVLHQKCQRLSWGEQQRIAIIRALIQPFEWIFLDEPFSHLDEKHIAYASELIQEECNKRKAGMLMASLGYKYLFDYHQEFRL